MQRFNQEHTFQPSLIAKDPTPILRASQENFEQDECSSWRRFCMDYKNPDILSRQIEKNRKVSFLV